MLPLEHATEEQDGASVVLRWFSSCGKVLVWESEAHAMRFSEDRYWQPLAVRLPLWPKGAAWLRFEICSACKRRTPLAAGFVFPYSRAPEHPGLGELPGVLSPCLTTAETARVKFAHKPLAELLASAPRIAIDVVRNVGQPWVTIDVSSFEYVAIANSRAAAPNLVLATGLRRIRFASAPLSLPLALVLDSENVLFAGQADTEEQRLFIIVPRLIDVMQAGESADCADLSRDELVPGVH